MTENEGNKNVRGGSINEPVRLQTGNITPGDTGGRSEFSPEGSYTGVLLVFGRDTYQVTISS